MLGASVLLLVYCARWLLVGDSWLGFRDLFRLGRRYYLGLIFIRLLELFGIDTEFLQVLLLPLLLLLLLSLGDIIVE